MANNYTRGILRGDQTALNEPGYAPGSNLQQDRADGAPTAAATLVVKDGRLLIGDRRNHEGICGPGGHIEDGETPEQAARREAMEEFGIKLGSMYCLGQLDGLPEEYGVPVVISVRTMPGILYATVRKCRELAS